MRFDPYSPPADLEKAPCVRLPPREAVQYRMYWSLGCAALSCISIVAMVCLVEWYNPGQSLVTSDAFRFTRVLIPLCIAGSAASLAFLFSAPVFLSGRIMPATWLLPLTLFILWFFTFYDWEGLFYFSKPRLETLEFGVGQMTLLFADRDFHGVLFYIIVGIIFFQWLRLDTCRTAARDAAAFDQIVADEIEAQSGPKL